MIVGGYTLDLYCDNEQEDNHIFYTVSDNYYLEVGGKQIDHQFVGESFSECAREARKYGWLVNRKKNKCLCPVCNGKM